MTEPKAGPGKAGKKGFSLPGNPAQRLAQSSSAGYDLAANVLVGIGLGWACIHFFPATSPWGFLGFMALGILSGFWQLFRDQLRSSRKPGPKP